MVAATWIKFARCHLAIFELSYFPVKTIIGNPFASKPFMST
jgi:hypothetical protein